MTLDKMKRAEDYRRLAEEEASLAGEAISNESRAQHYAMAAYYIRLADAKEKLGRTSEFLTVEACSDGPAPRKT